MYHESHVHISQRVKIALMRNLQHTLFRWRRRYGDEGMETKVLADFQICISVPLSILREHKF